MVQSFAMRYEDENIWVTQKMMATLYDVSVAAINQHIKKYMRIQNWSQNQLLSDYPQAEKARERSTDSLSCSI